MHLLILNENSNGLQKLLSASPNLVCSVQKQPYDTCAKEISLKFCMKKKEILLFNNLFSHVNLVRFEKGKIELNPKADAPKDLASKVSQLLFEWTKIKWHILMTKEKGDPTLEEQNEKLKVNDMRILFTKDFRKKSEKPFLKGAFVEESIYIGDDQISTLVSLKSKEEVIGEIIGLLQSPVKNIISSLKSGDGKLSAILKTLSNQKQ